MSTHAAPRPHDEHVDDVWLFECLSFQDKRVRYNPTGTSWIWAYRGEWCGKHVLFFRPAPWMLEGATQLVGEEIHEDIGTHALRLGRARVYCWAMVEAPPGVRLRAIVLELARRGLRLADAIVIDLVAQTRKLIAASGRSGDTFVTWDGGLWLAPEFPECWAAEHPSHHGDELWDTLVLEHAFALHSVLSGELDSSSPLPADVSPAIAAIVDEANPESSASFGDAFFARCAAIGGARCAAPELARLAHELFADVYTRQCAIGC